MCRWAYHISGIHIHVNFKIYRFLQIFLTLKIDWNLICTKIYPPKIALSVNLFAFIRISNDKITSENLQISEKENLLVFGG